MNKKFLTALLLGAFTIASTSTLVSCKDYDDDIDALQEQINQNDKDIANLQAALTKAETDLKAEIASLRNDLTEEQARAKAAEQTLTTNLNDEIARAKAAEGKLTTDLNDAVARIANLETRLDLAENTLKEVQATLAKKVDQSVFDEAIADINASLKTLGDNLAEAQEKLQKAIDDEKARALAAEAVLQGNIDAEEAARIAAVNAEETARIAAVKAEETARIAAIDAEKTAREAAVKELQLKDEALEAFDKAIDKRVKAIEDDYLTSADKKELKDAIDEEVKARKEDIAAVRSELATAIAKLDSELRALVAAEKAALEGKISELDTRLTKAIQDEASAREAADKKEAQERIAAINELQGKLDAAVISLQNQINNLSKKVDEEVARLDEAIAQEIADRETAIAQEVIDRNKAIQDAKDEITAAYTTAITNAIDQEVSDRNQAIDDAKEAITTAYTTAITNAIDQEVRDRNQAIEQAIEGAKEAITAAYTAAIAEAKDELQGEIDDLDEKIEKINTNLINLFWQSLRALVFEPAAYYHGIEAIEVSTLNFKGLTLKYVAGDANAEQGDDAPTKGAAVVVAPEIVATYHLNPSSANVSKDVEQYEFLHLDCKFYKALASDQLPITSVASEAGKLTVKAKVLDASLIKNIAADGEVTVVALQYTDAVKDTTITSDYAALRASFISNFRVNKAFDPAYTTDGVGLDETTPYAAVAGHNHLDTTAAEAIEGAAKFTIPYNNAGIDLTELVNTHVAYQDGSSDVAIDAKAADGTLKAQKGITYKFELIGYKIEGKSESAWAAINEDGKTFRPQPAKANGEQDAYDAKQNKTEIGHEPLVRVTLIEETSGKIVAVGYMKFRITTANPNLTEHFTNTKAYTLGCGNDSSVLVYDSIHSVAVDPQEALTAATFKNISDAVKQELNIIADEFKDLYVLEKTYPYGIVKQYDENGTELTEYFGDVTIDSDSSLTWTVTNNRAYQYFKQDPQPKTMTTRVRYKALNVLNPKSPLEYIYVQFIWTPSKINITPTAEFSKSSDARIAEYWYAKNSGVAGSGFDDIHGNVEVVGTGNCEFVFDVKNTLVGNIVQLAKDEKYTAINNSMKVHFEFVKPNISTEVPGASGKKYKLLVSTTDPSQLQAQIDTEDPQNVAKIIRTDIRVPADLGDEAGVITFDTTEYAKDLLNYADHNLLGDRQTLTAKVGVKVTTCDPINSSDEKIVVKNDTFNVKFLRPITITDGKAKFTDAMTGGDTQPVSLTFTDWRHTDTTEVAKNYEFNFRQTKEGRNYWEYYDVSKIEADITNITTTLNGGTLGETKLSGITNKLSFIYLKPGQSLADRTADPEVVPTDAAIKTAIQNNHDYGKLYYKNNGLTVGGFKIRVPIVVTYKWGTIRSYVDCEIGNTIGNVKKK